MNTIQLKTHVGEDGILNLQIPTGVQNQEIEVLVVIQPIGSPSLNRQSVMTKQKQQAQQSHPRAYEPWTEDEEKQLLSLHECGYSIREICDELGRQPGAIRSRLRKLSVS